MGSLIFFVIRERRGRGLCEVVGVNLGGTVVFRVEYFLGG